MLGIAALAVRPGRITGRARRRTSTSDELLGARTAVLTGPDPAVGELTIPVRDALLESAAPGTARRGGTAALKHAGSRVRPNAEPAARRQTEAGPDIRISSVSALSRAQRAQHLAIALLWAAATATFWLWWLGHAARSTPWLYWTQTVTLFYQSTVLPSFFWFFVSNMRRPVEPKASAGTRVAMITLCVPTSESLAVIHTQLKALAQVEYPHDSWVLDEGSSEAVRELADACGVRYFSRLGVPRWNEPAPPFQASTKAGNVNAWLDHIRNRGEDYDVFVQLDIDHRPRRDYLDRVLGYFRDPRVAWVQAPSVCGNLEDWAARGLAEQDLVFQGPLQMGFYGATETPFIIGSHTSYRTRAIREIGGFQPTRAEDHLDTVVLAAHGYRGVFLPDLIAVGDGPHDFATYLRQQFAWAYSMIEIFIRHTPRLIRRYTPSQAFQFLMCQSWYTMWSLSLALLWLLPAVALFAHRPIALVSVSEFVLYFLPVPLTSALMWCWARRWFQPGGVRLSWRGVILEIARWPVVLWALINVVLRVKRSYMITPKGLAGQTGPRARSIYGPYVFMTALPLAALWTFQLTGGTGGAQGYFGLALANAALGLLLLKTTVILEIREFAENGAGVFAAMRVRAGVLACSLGLLVLLTVSTVEIWAPVTRAIS
jgi:cellulose synthase (UDP-forming)